MSYTKGAKDGKHYWLTPPDLMAMLDKDFHFDFDPCPYPQPEGFDGLTVEWGKSNYVNPPFCGPTKWARKAIAEFKKGKKIVFVFPIDKWIHLFLEAGAEIRNLKDVRWCSTEDGKPGKGTGRWIACFILDPGRYPMATKEDMRAWLRKKKHFAVNAENRQEVDMCDSILAALSGPGEEEREELVKWLADYAERYTGFMMSRPYMVIEPTEEDKKKWAEVKALILGHAEGGEKK